jgi:hypothetical protein
MESKGSTDDDESEQQRCAESTSKVNGIAFKIKTSSIQR